MRDDFRRKARQVNRSADSSTAGIAYEQDHRERERSTYLQVGLIRICEAVAVILFFKSRRKAHSGHSPRAHHG